MPVIVPVLLIGAGAVSAVGGVANAARGSQKMRRARQRAAQAGARYETETAATHEATELTSLMLRTYGDNQEAALQAVVHRMIDFMRRHDQMVAERASELLAGVSQGTSKVDEFGGARLTAEGLAGHLVTTAIASAVTYTGVPMAVATDCNPGSSPIGSLPVAMNLACLQFGLTPWEALAGVTRHAAQALGALHECGTLEPGKRADLAVWDVEDPVEIVERLGDETCAGTWLGGVRVESSGDRPASATAAPG